MERDLKNAMKRATRLCIDIINQRWDTRTILLIQYETHVNKNGKSSANIVCDSNDSHERYDLYSRKMFPNRTEVNKIHT